MNVSLHGARNSLAWSWMVLSAPLILLVIFQWLSGKYGVETLESLTGFGWLFQAVLPTAAVMIAPLTVPRHPQIKDRKVENLALFAIAIGLFIFYFIILYAIVLAEPWTTIRLENRMLMS